MTGALIFDPTGVATPPAPTLSGNEVWGTEGDGMSVRGTKLTADTWNKVGGELSAILNFFLTLDMSNRTQFLGLLQAGFAGVLNKAAMSAINDLNAAPLGLSRFTVSSANAPTSSGGIVETTSTIGSAATASNNALMQTATVYGVAMPYTRQNFNNGGWTAWTQSTPLSEFGFSIDSSANYKIVQPDGAGGTLIRMGGTISIPATGGGPYTYNFPFGGFPNLCVNVFGSFQSALTAGQAASVGFNNFGFTASNNKTQFTAGTSANFSGSPPFGANWEAVGN